MIRRLVLPALAVALLGGCVTGYQYRGANSGGDYYYGEPSVEYRDSGYGGFGYGGFGYPGRWHGGFSLGYGGAWGYPYGFGYYGYPYGYGGWWDPYQYGRPIVHHRRKPGPEEHKNGDDQDNGDSATNRPPRWREPDDPRTERPRVQRPEPLRPMVARPLPPQQRFVQPDPVRPVMTIPMPRQERFVQPMPQPRAESAPRVRRQEDDDRSTP